MPDDKYIDAFTVAEGAARGHTPGRLRGPSFTAPFHGVRVAVGDSRPRSDADRRLAEYAPHLWELRLLAERYAPRLRPGHVFSHDTALALMGAPTPRGWTPTLHVSVYRPSARPQTAGVIGHRLQARSPAVRAVHGLPVEDPARAWVQVSRTWAADDLIAAADSLVLPARRLATLATLRAEAGAMRGHALDRTIADVRVGAESFRETRLRLACQRAGLPEPRLNVDVFDASGSFIARIDQLYEEFGVAAEYDGRQHARDDRQFARDADRWEAIRAAGWEHVRILRHHLEPDPMPAVAKIRAALVRGGWWG
jgi:hypothetical protein